MPCSLFVCAYVLRGLRMMQLFTGAVKDNPNYESQPLSEKSNFVEFMVLINDTAPAFFPAYALLIFFFAPTSCVA